MVQIIKVLFAVFLLLLHCNLSLPCGGVSSRRARVTQSRFEFAALQLDLLLLYLGAHAGRVLAGASGCLS